MGDLRIAVRGTVKSFPGTRALDGVDLDIIDGEIHALVGENGAGKSTLARILAGAIQPDAGEILLDGTPVSFRSPREAIDQGVLLVPQELMLVPRLTVAQNVWLGRRVDNPSRAKVLLGKVLDRIGAEFSPGSLVARLDRPSKQRVQLARGLCLAKRVLLLDEPTEGLTTETYRRLREILREEARRALTIVYVSHRLAEVLELADRITVLRDGRIVDTFQAATTSERELIRAMAGRFVNQQVTRQTSPDDSGDVLLRVRGLSGRGFHDVDLEARSGEVVGLAGVPGSGKSELLRAISGAALYESGSVEVCGSIPLPGSPSSTLACGAAFLPADRIRDGLVPVADVRTNMVLSDRSQTVRRGVRRRGRELRLARSFVERLRIATPSVQVPVRTLSGGNQQKVLIARLMLRNSRVWLLEEPTQGVDVAGKAEIHDLIAAAADEGRTILVASSEMKELIDLADRIIVMRMGERIAEIDSARAHPEELLMLSLPVGVHAG